MLIGIDFDNTIVSYDTLFYKIALEKSLIPHELEPTKTQVRDYLRKINKEDIWTEMQGYVYGEKMGEAKIFPGVCEFMRWAVDSGIKLAIVSHKTKFPFIGKQYDLHKAARKWIEAKLLDIEGKFISDDQIFFELTKEDKVNRIDSVVCDYFIDDLPDILLAPKFPVNVNKILFDPLGAHGDLPNTYSVNSWDEIRCLLQQNLLKKN